MSISTRSFKTLLVALSMISAAASAQADSYSTGFESPTFSTGSIDNQDGWQVWNNSVGPVEEVTTSGAIAGAQSWRVSNEWVSGVVQHENSPALNDLAGPAATNKQFTTSFLFKAASASGDGSFVQISPDDASGGRYGGRIDLTHVPGVVAPFDGRGALQSLSGLQIGWNTITNSGESYVISSALDASKTYRVDLSVNVVAGTGVGGAPNDAVSLTVTDTSDNSVDFSANSANDGISTWESAGFGGAGVDRLTFRHKWQWTGTSFQEGVDGVNIALGSQPQGFYVDDLSIATAVPEPATLALGGLASLGLLAARRRRLA
jgi:hypothetical protein